MARMRGGKPKGVFNTTMELLKAGSVTMILELHTVEAVVWHSGAVPPS